MKLINQEYVNEKEKKAVSLFLHSQNTKKYILGINKLTRSLQKHVQVDGIIDDFTRVQRSRKKEVLKIEDVPRDALIVWTSTGSPLEVKRRLDAMGFYNISYLALLKYSTLNLEPHPFMMDFQQDYKKNSLLYTKLYNRLEDERSKEVFTKLINFKISFDYTFMQGFKNDHEGQYFEKEIIAPIKNIVFVDGGGYVGDTSAQVIKNYADFQKIYLIEPIAQNMRIAKRELSCYENIEFINAGVWHKKETLHFNEEKSFSNIFGKGTQSVEVDTLDNIIKERVDYIKLDIEGAEQNAIRGATKSIKKYKPILAICVYHKAEDWYKVPELIFSIYPHYRVYLRHYMEGIFETVMYFIPKET